MKDLIFATVNGQKIDGYDILYMKKRIESESSEESRFANTPNEDNQGYLNSEALQRLIDIYALVAIARFEGIEVTDEDITNVLYELRSSYEDEFDWETILDDMGINDKNIRKIFYHDMMVDKLLLSYMEQRGDFSQEIIEEFYHQNINSMKLPDSYSFIEVEIKDMSFLKLAATILSQNDTASILNEAKSQNLDVTLNEDIAFPKLPDTLQEVFKDLEENKIGTIPMEDDSVVLVKLLRKFSGKELTLEESSEGIIEYLKFQNYRDILDELTLNAIEKCDIVYENTDLLKKLK